MASKSEIIVEKNKCIYKTSFSRICFVCDERRDSYLSADRKGKTFRFDIQILLDLTTRVLDYGKHPLWIIVIRAFSAHCARASTNHRLLSKMATTSSSSFLSGFLREFHRRSTVGMDAEEKRAERGGTGVQARQLMSCGRYQGRRPPHCFSTMSPLSAARLLRASPFTGGFLKDNPPRSLVILIIPHFMPATPRYRGPLAVSFRDCKQHS